ncbi:MAG: hypothetical protein US63_C0001G0026 [Candidatus Moranbacteria bacterium GW2011_GWC2_37_8]|nr:MAG: hypothetical protein US63_C0001G0026 [Candidatus Moranbacteria bacterium GW2011_GWC2_37_8]KKQ63077.1 MAG: hypothetical protein US82_C0003G0026 [Parcubacteria group bacterium GW2011_GWC1_38_22]KKQ79730.1 MAG: hypothetical protein UT03_C0043G0010 [Candidatus Moranbacteria bacterium GW2011_GWD2_38_7]
MENEKMGYNPTIKEEFKAKSMMSPEESKMSNEREQLIKKQEELKEVVETIANEAGIEKNVNERINAFRKFNQLMNDVMNGNREGLETDPKQLVEMINKTSLKPLLDKYNTGTFDHELENFSFIVASLDRAKNQEVAKAFWDKLVNENPEPVLERSDNMRVVLKYIEGHPNYRVFVDFISSLEKTKPSSVLIGNIFYSLRSTNGLFPQLLDGLEDKTITGWEKTRDEKGKVTGGHTAVGASYVETAEQQRWDINSRWEDLLEKRALLSEDDSKKVIEKVNELFFQNN